MNTNSIENRLGKIKPYLGPINLLLLAALSFGLGRWSKIEEGQNPITIEQSNSNIAASPTQSDRINNQLVASKNGTKYHYSWCPGAAQIKEANKIWFASAEAAKRAGYTAASNCPGL